MRGRSEALVVGLVLLAAACSDAMTTDGQDAAVPPADAGPNVDAGARDTCPIAANSPACQKAEDCGNQGSAASYCHYCPTYNTKLCALGQCQAPPGAGLHTVRFDIGDLTRNVLSFEGMALDAETTGGLALSCADVYGGRLSWSEPCYNIGDVSYSMAVNGSGSVFPMFFDMFASGRKVLFVVYAFAEERAGGDPIGVSCTEKVVPEAAGQADVEGDRMRNLP